MAAIVSGLRPSTMLGTHPIHFVNVARYRTATVLRAERRRQGSFYTPVALAHLLARETLAPLAGPLSILDPACGDGALLRAAHALAPEARLTGADLDAEALARAPGERIHADALRHDWGGRTFDVVLCNPPWVSFSGRHGKSLGVDERRDLARRFKSFGRWPTLHGPFVELAMQLATRRVGLLLPAQVREFAGYDPLRCVVGARGRSVAWIDLGEDAFEGVVQPACMLIVEIGEGAAARHDPPRPGGGLFADIGVHTGNCAASLLDSGGAPIREGRDITPYALAPPRRTLRTDLVPAPGEYFRIAPLDRYAAFPILLRQTASRPIAALHTRPTYFRNSVLACRGIPGVDDALVVAWLNSSAVADFHRNHVAESRQRAFPQIKLRHLNALPMPRWEEAPPEVVELSRLVAREGRADLAGRLDAVVGRFCLKAVRAARRSKATRPL